MQERKRRSRFWRPCGKGVSKLNVIVPLESVSIQSERISGYVEAVEGNIEDAGGGGDEVKESSMGARIEEGGYHGEINNSVVDGDRNENEDQIEEGEETRKSGVSEGSEKSESNRTHSASSESVTGRQINDRASHEGNYEESKSRFGHTSRYLVLLQMFCRALIDMH